MTPLDNAVMVEENMNLDQIQVILKENLRSRVPVYRKDRKNVVGVLYIKDLFLRSFLARDNFTLRNMSGLIRKAFVAYIDEGTNEVLKHMRYHKVHIAIVKNRDERTVGLITIEDMLEEIVGEIQDEYEK